LFYVASKFFASFTSRIPDKPERFSLIPYIIALRERSIMDDYPLYNIKDKNPKQREKISGISKSQRNLQKLMLEVVDETLKKFFGEASTLVVYGYLERKHNLRKEDIPRKPNVFSKSLREMFVSGAILIEESILNNLFSKLKLEYKEWRELTFTEAIRRLSNRISSNKA